MRRAATSLLASWRSNSTFVGSGSEALERNDPPDSAAMVLFVALAPRSKMVMAVKNGLTRGLSEIDADIETLDGWVPCRSARGPNADRSGNPHMFDPGCCLRRAVWAERSKGEGATGWNNGERKPGWSGSSALQRGFSSAAWPPPFSGFYLGLLFGLRSIGGHEPVPILVD